MNGKLLSAESEKGYTTMILKNAIFDLDGTLIDSMPIWRNYQMDIMEELNGIVLPPEERKLLVQYPFDELISAVEENHRVQIDRHAVSVGCNERMSHRYLEGSLEVKPYVREYLAYLKAKNCGVALATATPKALCVPFLQQKELYGYFDCIFTTPDDTHIGKRESSAVYDAALAALGGTKQNTAVFEDVLVCMQTCKKNGYYTVAVPDSCQAATLCEIRATADRFITSYKDLMNE